MLETNLSLPASEENAKNSSNTSSYITYRSKHIDSIMNFHRHYLEYPSRSVAILQSIHEGYLFRK